MSPESKNGGYSDTLPFLAEGKRRSGGTPFPEPVARVGANRPLWHWSEVDAWFRDVLGTEVTADRTLAITRAINAALALRRAEARLSPIEAAPISSWVRPYIESRSA